MADAQRLLDVLEGFHRDVCIVSNITAGEFADALRAGLADTARWEDIDWFACTTGDCEHEKQADCDVAILGVLRSILAERSASLNGVLLEPGNERSGRAANSQEK